MALKFLLFHNIISCAVFEKYNCKLNAVWGNIICSDRPIGYCNDVSLFHFKIGSKKPNA